MSQPVVSTIKFFLPPALQGVIRESAYRLWLRKKSLSLLLRDKKANRPCAKNATRAVYAGKIHEAVCANPLYDPFTADAFRWDLIGQYDPKRAMDDPEYFKRFSSLPSIDHCDPDAADLGFELCTWLVNRCKSQLSPREFVALCKKICVYRKKPAALRAKRKVLAPPLAETDLPSLIPSIAF